MQDTFFHKGERVMVINPESEYYKRVGEIFSVERLMDGDISYCLCLDYKTGRGKKAVIKHQSVAGFNYSSLKRI